MRNQRTFSIEFERQVIEEWLSGTSSLAQLSRRHAIAPSLLYHWKERYIRGKLSHEPTESGALQARLEELEKMVGRLTLENEFLKKELSRALSPSKRNSSSSLLPTNNSPANQSRSAD
ncbi:MAG: transposase [Coprothermobacterota bacterium]|nr:transposase [Coprothermobacterota bacterium]